MKLITKEVSNPEKKFWIWDEKITNKQDGRIYPHNTTNVGSGKKRCGIPTKREWQGRTDCTTRNSRL